MITSNQSQILQNKQIVELNTIFEKVKKENVELNEELKFVKEECHKKTNQILYLETLNKQLTFNMTLKKIEDKSESKNNFRI